LLLCDIYVTEDDQILGAGPRLVPPGPLGLRWR
jgi:hypothetical protein